MMQLVEGVAGEVQYGEKDVDILEWMERAALELIGQAGMGHSFDPLTANTEPDEYTKAAKTYLYVTSVPAHAMSRLSAATARSPSRPSWSRCARRARSSRSSARRGSGGGSSTACH